MIEHLILIEAEVPFDPVCQEIISHCVSHTLEAQGLIHPCEINVLLTDDQGIAQINQEMREKDTATDVLSFPMFPLEPGIPPNDPQYLDQATGTLPLGDMVLSLERVAAQGEEFCHGFAQELRYLVLHSLLHLLGYDHLDEGVQKQEMRQREKEIISILDHKGEK